MNKQLTVNAQRIEARLQARFSTRQPQAMYAPMHYLLKAGGKRVRPQLVMLAYEACGGQNTTAIIDLAVAVELFHNFTLVHDDIMDAADLRRGRPTVHVQYDEPTAILAGDAMYTEAFKLVVMSFPERAALLAEIFASVAMGVCEGQAEDMAYTGQFNVMPEQYIEMIRKKTAVLLGGSLQLGALAAGVSLEDSRLMYLLGEKIGIGFQLNDDYLDVYAEADFGKTSGGDILQDKNTYLRIRALQKADRYQKEALLNWSNVSAPDDGPAKVQAVKAIYDALEIGTETQRLANRYHNEGQQLLSDIASFADTAPLTEFFDWLRQRQT